MQKFIIEKGHKCDLFRWDKFVRVVFMTATVHIPTNNNFLDGMYSVNRYQASMVRQSVRSRTEILRYQRQKPGFEILSSSTILHTKLIRN